MASVSSCRLLLVSVLLAILFSIVSSQGYDFFGGYFSRGLARDQRANRAGPVVFPSNAPPGAETSGVRVGASGYGFVPPSGPAGPVTGALPGAGPNYIPGVSYW